MSYIRPNKVTSPKKHWSLTAVLLDGGEGGCSYAIGTWDEECRIGFRWNGHEGSEIGNPQSRGLPTWTMLDPKLHLAIIQGLPQEKQVLACSLLGIEAPPMIEMKIRHHPSGNYTLSERPSGQRLFEDAPGALFTNDRADEFLEAFYNQIRTHLNAGTRVSLKPFPSS